MAASRTPTAPRYPNLAAEIARQGWTFSKLSHPVDCHAQYIGQIIRGYAQPSEAIKQRIADVLGRPVDELFAEAVVTS